MYTFLSKNNLSNQNFKTMHKKIIFLLVTLISSLLVDAQENVQWKFKTNDRVYSSPIIDGNFIYFGSGDHNLYAVNKNTGKEVWRFNTKGAVHSSPFIRKNLVYFASADGFLYAVNKKSGKEVWKFKSNGEKMYGLWDYYLSSPIEENGSVYWGSGDGHVYAVDSKTGKLKWKYLTQGIVHATPAIYKGNIVIGSFDGYFYCIQKETGSLVWKFRTIGAAYFPKGEVQKAALVDGDFIYFGSRDYNIYALNGKTGRGIWNMKQPRGWITATPTVYKENIYFGTSDAHKFYSMNKLSGITNWTAKVNMRVYGTAVPHSDIIYFGTFDGKIIGVDYKTGKTKWEFQTESSKLNYSKLYNKDGEFIKGFELYGKNFKDSEKLIHTLGSILSTPLIDNGTIYFGSSDGNLYSVKLK